MMVIFGKNYGTAKTASSDTSYELETVYKQTSERAIGQAAGSDIK